MQSLNSKILLNSAIFLVLCHQIHLEGIGNGAYYVSTTKEKGGVIMVITTEVVVGIQEILNVDR